MEIIDHHAACAAQPAQTQYESALICPQSLRTPQGAQFLTWKPYSSTHFGNLLLLHWFGFGSGMLNPPRSGAA